MVKDNELLEMLEVSADSKVEDFGSIVFIIEPSGKVHEHWLMPDCKHAIEGPDCPDCRDEETRRNKARSEFYKRGV